jgi:hypothetical protein
LASMRRWSAAAAASIATDRAAPRAEVSACSASAAATAPAQNRGFNDLSPIEWRTERVIRTNIYTNDVIDIDFILFF